MHLAFTPQLPFRNFENAVRARVTVFGGRQMFASVSLTICSNSRL
jgi:hypothetical protein